MRSHHAVAALAALVSAEIVDDNGVQWGVTRDYAEAKAKGYDPKIMRKVVAIRKQDPGDLAEIEALLDTYLAALGL